MQIVPDGVTTYVPTNERTTSRFPLILTTGRILSQYDVGARTRRTGNVVCTTFHHPVTGADVVTTENSDWVTNCPEYKVTAVQVGLAHPHTRSGAEES